MNSPDKGTAAATTNDESAVLGAATSPSATTTIMSSLPRGPDDRNDNSAAAATAAIGQDSHGDDGEPPRPAAANGAGLEIIEDEDGPLLPPSMTAMPFDGDAPDLDAARTAASRYVGKPAKARLEVIQDDTRPDLPVFMMEFTDSKNMELIVARPPRPINIAEIGDAKDALKKGQPPPRQQLAREDSIVIPPSEDMDDDDLRIHTNRRGGRAEEFLLNANVAPSNHGGRAAEDEEANVRNGNPEDALARPDLERDSTFRVPEAVLVEESNDEIYMGEPIEPPLPWWKLKQVRRSFILVCVVLLAAAIALGVALPSGNNASGTPETVIVMAPSTNAPSSSFAPSVSSKPTSSPSDDPSPVPSSHPSTCVAKIVSNRQKIDLSIDDPQQPEVAVDGKNAVVVVHGPQYKGSLTYVIFHSLKNDEWQSVDTFPIDDLGNQDCYSVALSGKTAFVGFEEANDDVGTVLVFEQDQFGSWEKVEDPFVHVASASHEQFGICVGIDGDLAFVSDYNNVYMFRKGSYGKWVEFDRVDGYGIDHSISGDVIATHNYDGSHIQLYKYTPALDGVLPIQDPIPTGYIRSMGLSNDYLAYWDWCEEDAFVYRREEANRTFAFHQRLNISVPISIRLALDSDILVVDGLSSTHIFSEQGGKWEETITLDQRYDYYALSGRQLLAATLTEVHAFDIQDCAQEMPTQTPSSSQMPTANPTTLPSTSPSSPPSIAPSSSVSPSTSPSTSIAPSSSTSPTSCYWLTIAIDYDDKPEETYWNLWRLLDDDDDDWPYTYETVRSHDASEGGTFYSESICLEEGEYQFDIKDLGFDGICCDHGEGSYNVTVDGTLIVEGGEFTRKERTVFSLPFVAGTNVTTIVF